MKTFNKVIKQSILLKYPKWMGGYKAVQHNISDVADCAKIYFEVIIIDQFII